MQKSNNLGMTAGAAGLVAVTEWSASVNRIAQQEAVSGQRPVYKEVKMPVGIHFP